MSASRPMSRLLRTSSRHLARPTCSASHTPSLIRPSASLLRPSLSLSSTSASSLSSARRSFFSRTSTSADSQQQSSSSASTPDQQSTQQSSSSTNANNTQQTAQQPASSASSTPNNNQSSSSTTASSTQQQQQQADTASATAQLQQQLTTAQTQQKETYDRLLRTAAEMENLRRTTRIDVDNARKYATTAFAKSILEVADTLELAGKSARDALQAGQLRDEAAVGVVRSLLEGIEMTERVLGKVLQDNGVVKQEALGSKFNPHEHHGLFEVEGEAGQEAGTIAHVMKNGYKIHDRILRAAQVGTVKAAKKA